MSKLTPEQFLDELCRMTPNQKKAVDIAATMYAVASPATTPEESMKFAVENPAPVANTIIANRYVPNEEG